MNITLRQLRAFVAVAETGQFTKAAQHVHITQAALSMLIRDLEEEIGLRLFDRHTRMVKLTQPGSELLGMARRVLAEVESAVQHSRDLTTHQRGRVVIACGTVLSTTLLIPFMRKFQERYPGIKLELLDMAEQDIHPRLSSESIDFGLGTKWIEDDEIESQHLFDDNYQALLPPEHPLTRNKTIKWTELAQYPFIALSSHSPLHQEIARHFASQNIDLPRIQEVSFHTTVLAMVRNGMGLSVLPANTRALPESASIVFKPLSKPVLNRQICLFQLGKRFLSPASQLFKDELIAFTHEFPDGLASAQSPISE